MDRARPQVEGADCVGAREGKGQRAKGKKLTWSILQRINGQIWTIF